MISPKLGKWLYFICVLVLISTMVNWERNKDIFWVSEELQIKYFHFRVEAKTGTGPLMRRNVISGASRKATPSNLTMAIPKPLWITWSKTARQMTVPGRRPRDLKNVQITSRIAPRFVHFLKFKCHLDIN